LNLSKNRISDEGFVHIVKALCDSGIEVLDMSSNKITEKCIESVVGSLKTHKVLKQLDLQDNGLSGRVVKNKLKNALPSIEVLV
jgi:Ran GTPase-activating protein (RanGAP) involved in mRNA processing and transport